jgi:hypothetical protein
MKALLDPPRRVRIVAKSSPRFNLIPIQLPSLELSDTLEEILACADAQVGQIEHFHARPAQYTLSSSRGARRTARRHEKSGLGRHRVQGQVLLDGQEVEFGA